jgi:hypothetical protein
VANPGPGLLIDHVVTSFDEKDPRTGPADDTEGSRAFPDRGSLWFGMMICGRFRLQPAVSGPAGGSCLREGERGNLDPSRGRRPTAAGRPAGGPGDRVFLRRFADVAGLRHDAAGGVLWRGSDRCSSAVPGRRNGRSRKECRSLEPDKTSDAEQLRPCVPFPPEGETGHQPHIMAV